MSRKTQGRRAALPDWLAGFSDDDGTEGISVRAAHNAFEGLLTLKLLVDIQKRRCTYRGVVPIRRLDQVMKQGVGMTMACQGLHVWADNLAPGCGLTAAGEVRLMPDVESRINCLWHPPHDMMVADMHEAPGIPWSCCPRNALRKVLEDAEHRHGLRFRIGHEVEFYLLRPGVLDEISKSALPEPVDNLSYAQSVALNGVSGLLDEICDCLDALGIPIEQFHAESGPGQFEISPAPTYGLQAADNVLYTRETISAIAQRHGLLATFLPKPFSQAGSGAHTHFSMQSKDGKAVLADLEPGLKANGSFAESFLAGIWMHLPALLLFTTPSPLSYHRIAPGTWSGAFRSWGMNNRETPIRFIPYADSRQTNFEIKSVDNTCNPYIAYAAIITAGLKGAEEKLSLPPATLGDPADDDSPEALPASLEAAIAAFESDKAFKKAMEDAIGAPLLQSYVAVRKCEQQGMKGRSHNEQLLTLCSRY